MSLYIRLGKEELSDALLPLVLRKYEEKKYYKKPQVGLGSALLREVIIYFHLNHSGYDLVPRDAEDAGHFGRTVPWPLESYQPPWVVCEQVMMWVHSPCTGKGTLRAGQPG